MHFVDYLFCSERVLGVLDTTPNICCCLLCMAIVFDQPKACTSSRESSFSTSHFSMSTSFHAQSA